MSGLDPAVVERVRRERAAQGLPPTIEDPGCLARVAKLLLASDEDDNASSAA